MINEAISKLVTYALRTGLISQYDTTWAVNAILEVLKLDSYADPSGDWVDIDLSAVLDELTDDAYARGVLAENSIAHRDLFETALMGRLTPRPAQVIEKFQALCWKDPQKGIDWYYKFSQDTNYIRRDRIAKDVQWKVPTEYGDLDIAIDLSKPEKDPEFITAAGCLTVSDYPRCRLCLENEGYAGRVIYPARQNHRVVPVTINRSSWFLQYSPHACYNEHCVCFNREHTPMKIDRACFGKLLDFVGQFPHYFVVFNADLPIVGSSDLDHEYFQGGRYTSALEKAPIEMFFTLPGFRDIEMGIVKWPMSVVRITGENPEQLMALADKFLTAWRGYTDERVFIFAETDGKPHNTITPIARRRGKKFELDLVLRNNITTEEHPLGVFHPHAELHHIKKESIGLIEVMGLAILPARLKEELAAVADALVSGADLWTSELTEKHADWADGFKDKYEFTAENALDIVQKETGLVFAKALEHAGVFARTIEGNVAFLRFLTTV